MQNSRESICERGYKDPEINFGVLEGVVCMNDAREYLDPQMEKFFTDPWNFERPKDGEKHSGYLARTKDFWEELIHDPATSGQDDPDRISWMCGKSTSS